MGFTIRVQAIPAKALNVKAVVKEIDAALEETGKILDKQFARTVESWEGEKPTFKHTTGGTGAGGGSAFVHSFPAGSPEGVEKWVRLDEGTKPHVIRPRGAYFLRFPWQGKGKSYKAKTTPRQLSSGAGGKLGPIRNFTAVNHPGHEAREWSQTLGEQEIGPFAERIAAAVEKGLKE